MQYNAWLRLHDAAWTGCFAQFCTLQFWMQQYMDPHEVKQH